MFEKRLTTKVNCDIDPQTGSVICKLVDLSNEDRYCNVQIYKDGRFLIKEATDPQMCVNFVLKYGESLKRAIRSGGKAFSFEIKNGKPQNLTAIEE